MSRLQGGVSTTTQFTKQRRTWASPSSSRPRGFSTIRGHSPYTYLFAHLPLNSFPPLSVSWATSCLFWSGVLVSYQSSLDESWMKQPYRDMVPFRIQASIAVSLSCSCSILFEHCGALTADIWHCSQTIGDNDSCFCRRNRQCI